MSEFKFACPVCGQHMMCDESQAGSVMDCPTCFQKIIAPQAPAPDSKFILTGTKLSEKKISMRGMEPPEAVAERKNLLLPALIVAALLLAAGAGIYFFALNPVGHRYHWTQHDIGDVHAAGSFSQAGSRLTLVGDGADIWFRQDAFNYVFVKLDGDGTITARVASLANTDPWAKAGVMFRDSLEAEAKFALACVTPASGLAFQVRADTGSDALFPGGVPNLTAPRWLRLTRQGGTFTAYASADGATWNKIGESQISLNRHAYAGLFVCSHRDGTLCQAQFDHVTVLGTLELETATATTPPPVTAPPKPSPPPANDTNWTMTLDGAVLPDSPVAGRIHGQDFLIERATFSTNGTLTLRAGQKGSLEFGAQINFGGATADALAGKAINVTAAADKAAPVTLAWKDADGVQKAEFDVGYAMRLEFGALANNRLPGKIYLCLPDKEKSYLMGSFRANVSKPRPPKQ